MSFAPSDFGDLSVDAVSARLTTLEFGRSLSIEASTESTNDDARRAAGAGSAHGHVVVADTQTRGRGSRGRTWLSPAGTDLYFSLVARLSLPALSLPPLTLVVGLAVAEALDAFLPEPLRPLVKWPNDLWVADKKLVGILVESASVGERLEPVVIGIGINVNRRSFPSGLDVPATSLALELGRRSERARVLAAVLNQLELRIDQFVKAGPGDAIAAINRRLALYGRYVHCGEFWGSVERVASNGALLLHTEGGPVECIAGTLRACESAVEAPA